MDAAYLAGLFDGEGCFTLVSRSGTYAPLFQLNMVDRPIVQWVADTLALPVKIQRKHNTNSRDSFVIRLTHRRAICLCKALLPYLRIKKPQAETIIQFEATYPSIGGVLLTDEVRAARTELAVRIRALNRPPR